jgi:hypothetical protein
LSRSDTIKLSVAGVLFVLCAVLFAINYKKLFGRPPDPVVNSFTVSLPRGHNIYRPLSKNNPPDPRHLVMQTTFANTVGRLNIRQFPYMTNGPTQLAYMPSAHWRVIWQKKTISGVSDKCQRGLVFAAMNWGNLPGGALRRMGLSDAQQAAIHSAVQDFRRSASLLRGRESAGSFHKALFGKMMAALKKYQAEKGDPIKDAARQRQARRVLRLGMQYVNAERHARKRLAKRMAAAVCKTLNDKQRAIIGGWFDRFAKRFL